ncbi:MAG: response regulator [Acidobacteria bacterium]|nr:response regulator [Acidobacteriota bacterium]
MNGEISNSANGSKKVLIIDDEESFRLVLREVLNELGFNSIEAENAELGLRAFEIERPSSVLLDIHLPDRSGFDVLQEIKKQSPKTNIIVTTGESIEENALIALRLGADEFIGKPIHPLELKYLLDKFTTTEKRTESANGILRLLIVSDAADGLRDFRGFINKENVQITNIFNLDDLPRTLTTRHEIAVVNVASINIKNVLESLRKSPLHQDIPVLVDKTRLDFTGVLAGIMPRFRAMPCSPDELRVLTQRRIVSLKEKRRSNHLL